MGWQTFCKLAENAYNNVPFGYSHGRDQDNTELLRILTPNMLRVGKINSRALQGPIKLPANRQELLEHVDKLYSGWFKIFKDTVVPRLVSQPKWFKLDKDLKEKDIVYFQKSESALGSTWIIGEVDQVIIGRDGLIRRAIIKYFNASENDPEHGKYHPQFTDRAVRKLIKLWSLDESCLFDDLTELQKKFDAGKEPLRGDEVVADTALPSGEVSVLGYASIGLNCDDDGPEHLLLSGEHVDLQLFTTPCDLTPLMVLSVYHHLHSDLGKDSDQQVDEEVDEEMQHMDTLTRIMVSTGFSLD